MPYTVQYVIKDKSVVARSPLIDQQQTAMAVAVDGVKRHQAAYAEIIDRDGVVIETVRPARLGV